ncbi:MAG: chorismate synthase [Bacteroidales bacterium]
MNSFGRMFRINLMGESHGRLVGVLIDGCPAGLSLREEDFRPDMERRRPGAKGTTARRDPDLPVPVTGVFRGYTTGAPLLIWLENRDTRPDDYSRFTEVPRPGHADMTALQKFGGYADYRGGGHFSGRLTAALVAAGVVAKKLLEPVKIEAVLTEAGGRKDIDAAVGKALQEKDSVGGIVECRVKGLPAGLGEPFFDGVESLVSHILFAIPAVKGVEFGAGFAAAAMRGSEHNDPLVDSRGTTATNHAGGINGGITSGNELVVRLAVKPASSISLPQKTYDLKKQAATTLEITGRHDACIALRVPVVAEAAMAVVLADLMMIEQVIPRVLPRPKSSKA